MEILEAKPIKKSYDKKWLSSECKKIIDEKKLIHFLADVASGDFLIEKLCETKGGRFELRPMPAELKDRLRAVEILLDRGYGKALQEIEMQVTESAAEKLERRKRILELIEYKNVA